MNSSSIPKAAAASVLPVAEVGSPTPLVLQVTNPGVTPSALPHAPQPEVDPCPGSHRQCPMHMPIVLNQQIIYRKSSLCRHCARSWEDENKQKVWPPEKESRNLGHSLFLPQPMPGMAMEDHEETSTLKLRSRVAGELAMEPRPPHPGWGRSPVMAQAPGTGGQ